MYLAVLGDVPSHFDVVELDDELGSRFAVLTPLAASEDRNRLVAVETCLIPFVKDDILFHEFQFAIAVTDEESGEAFRTYVRDMAVGYLPATVRPLVMPCVLGAAETLIKTVQPELIHRVTKAIRPPSKALHKHQMITDTMHNLGYKVLQSGTDEAGRPFWTLVK